MPIDTPINTANHRVLPDNTADCNEHIRFSLSFRKFKPKSDCSNEDPYSMAVLASSSSVVSNTSTPKPNLATLLLGDSFLARLNATKFSLPPSKLKSGSYLANFKVLYQNQSESDFKSNEEDEVYLKETLSEIAYSSYFNFNMSWRSLLNIPRDQYNALLELSKNEDSIIKALVLLY